MLPVAAQPYLQARKVTICNKILLLTANVRQYLDEMPTHSMELVWPTNEPTTYKMTKY
jgi:hypothetical protein